MTDSNINNVRIEWTDIQCEYLIDQRISRNIEFWNLSSRRQMCFWNSVTANINECFLTTFSAIQVRTKWNNLLSDHRVSIFYVNYYIIIYVLIFLIYLE